MFSKNQFAKSVVPISVVIQNKTKDVKKMRAAYEKVQASGAFVGNIPKREKDISKWSNP